MSSSFLVNFLNLLLVMPQSDCPLAPPTNSHLSTFYKNNITQKYKTFIWRIEGPRHPNILPALTWPQRQRSDWSMQVSGEYFPVQMFKSIRKIFQRWRMWKISGSNDQHSNKKARWDKIQKLSHWTRYIFNHVKGQKSCLCVFVGGGVYRCEHDAKGHGKTSTG